MSYYILWLVEIVMEGQNFRHIGFPVDCRTKLLSCKSKKFSYLVEKKICKKLRASEKVFPVLIECYTLKKEEE